MRSRMLWGLCLLCVAPAAAPAAGTEAAFRVAVPAKPAAPAAKPGPPAAAPDAATDTPDAAADTPHDSTTGIIQQVKENRRRLTAAAISAPEGATAPSGLREAIDRVRSISLKPPTPSEDTGNPKKAQERPAASTPAETAPSAPPILTAERLAKLKEQLQKTGADGFADPVALADALFRGGHLDHAYALYERLLADKTTDEIVKAWLLFQMANCKRHSDAPAAITLYGRLLSEYGKSPWGVPSKAYKTLLEWRQAVNPEAILKAINPPSPQPAAKGVAEQPGRTVESGLPDAVALPVGSER